MSIISDRIREQPFFHALADDAADEIETLEKEIEQIRAENEKLKAELCKYQHIASPEDRKVTKLLTEIDRLKAELTEAKKDAERLEFLVETPEFSLDFIGNYHTDEKRFIRRSIDEAMKGK